MEANYPYAIKNQRGANKIPPMVLYGIRLLAKQFLGTVLDMEVDQSGTKCANDLYVEREATFYHTALL